ncbi:MAG: hypothetical protein ACOX1U_04435 [Saccharofermentanales bacterium]
MMHENNAGGLDKINDPLVLGLMIARQTSGARNKLCLLPQSSW